MAAQVENFSLPEILYQVNHIFLPPKLPQENDKNASYDKKLVSAILLAISTFQGYFGQNSAPELEHAKRMIKCLFETRDENGLLDSNILDKRLLGLKQLDTLAIHITHQNAGLLITRSENEYLFESFELLARDNDVIACNGRLTRHFPGPSVAIDGHHIVDAGFRSVLIDTLVKLDRAPESDYSHDSKEKNKLLEENTSSIPDTASPRLVTEMIMAVIQAVGNPVGTPRICKHTREEVLLRRDAPVPWRRSPLWLLVRVSLQLVLDRLAWEFKAQSSLYKSFMVYLMTCILNSAVRILVSNDILYIMTAKISRRMLKLNPPESAPWLSYVEDSIGKVNSVLQSEWDMVRYSEEKPLNLSELSSLDFQQDTTLALPRLRVYLDQIDSPPPPVLQNRPRDALGHHFQRNEGQYLPRVSFTKDPEFLFFDLVDFEHSVEAFLGTNRSIFDQGSESGMNLLNNSLPQHVNPEFPLLGFRSQDESTSGTSVYSQYSIDSGNREIRVVVIERARFHQALKCHLAKTSLDTDSSFEALSYVWGNPNKFSTIRLNGHVFGVSKNLAAALRYIRSPKEDRVVWIDAICINQVDIPERSAQVKLMGDIYCTATRVISWLGEDVASDMATVRSFLNQVNEFGDLRRYLGDIIDQPVHSKIQRIIEAKDGVQAIVNCFMWTAWPMDRPLPYWHRTWITQELRLAKARIFQSKDIIISGNEIERYYFGDRQLSNIPIEFGKEKHPMYINSPDLAISENRTWKVILVADSTLRLDWVGKYSQKSMESESSSSHQETLLELLESNRYKDATDSRDKVFSLLGLVDPLTASHPGLLIDYNRSIRDVYIGTAHAIIESTRSLDIICSLNPTNSTPSLSLPSWVPDWSLSRGEYQVASVDTQDNRPTNPTQSLARFNLETGAEMVSALGSQFGEIIGSSSLQEEILGWKEHIRKQVEGYRALSNLVRPLSLPKDAFIDASNLNMYGGQFDVFKQTLCDCLKDDEGTRHPDYSKLDDFELDMRTLFQRHVRVSQRITAVRQRFGTNNNAIVGLCENGHRGDIVCLFLGCNKPVILRPTGKRFKVVGASFYSCEEIFRRLIEEGLKSMGKPRWFDLI